VAFLDAKTEMGMTVDLGTASYLLRYLSMSVETLQRSNVDKADFVGRDAHYVAILPMKLGDVLNPSSPEVSDIPPCMAEACKKRTWHLVERVQVAKVNKSG